MKCIILSFKSISSLLYVNFDVFLWMPLPPCLLRLPAFDDGVRVRHHPALPLPVAAHLPAHRVHSPVPPAGRTRAVPDGNPAPRPSSEVLPAPSTRGKPESVTCKWNYKRLKQTSVAELRRDNSPSTSGRRLLPLHKSSPASEITLCRIKVSLKRL